MLEVVPACGLLWRSLREAREYHCRATTPGNTHCGRKGPQVCTYGRKPLVAEARGYLAMSNERGTEAPAHDGPRQVRVPRLRSSGCVVAMSIARS